MVFCTLFNSGYLDKALVMYQSLETTCENDFKLYIVAFDKTAYEIISELGLKRAAIISLEDFESAELLEAKKTRTPREYMWTCSCMTIQYVLENYNEEDCTYIDVDLFFYSSPRPLWDELQSCHADVGIMLHGYILNSENQRYIDSSGKYCVEFNYFRNNDNGRRVLKWWCDQCLNCCTEIADGIHFGDQKYLEEFEQRFENVHVFENQGAGIAPWNLAKFGISACDKSLYLKKDKERKKIDLIFYHFQQISYISERCVDIHLNMYPGIVDVKVRNWFYLDYLSRIDNTRSMLKERFDLELAGSTVFSGKETFRNFLVYIIKYERNLAIAIKRLFRWIFRKKLDYIEW